MTLDELETDVFTLIKTSEIGVPAFMQDTRDPQYRGEYIEIIPLAFDESDFEGSAVINVNVHIPDKKGIKDTKRLNVIANKVREVFRKSKDAFEHYYTNTGKATLSIASSLDYKDDNETHFRNFRINVTYLNL